VSKSQNVAVMVNALKIRTLSISPADSAVS
jgi:hypothetical protein